MQVLKKWSGYYNVGTETGRTNYIRVFRESLFKEVTLSWGFGRRDFQGKGNHNPKTLKQDLICWRKRKEACLARVQRLVVRVTWGKTLHSLEDCDWEFGVYSNYIWKLLEYFELGINMLCFPFLLQFSSCTFFFLNFGYALLCHKLRHQTASFSMGFLSQYFK